MAFNYEFTKEGDGTFTIKDFQLVKAGTWYGHNAEEGLTIAEPQLAAIMDASARFHELIQPPLRFLHPVQGGGRQILAHLGKFKRVGDTIVADIKGMAADVFAQFKDGKLGRQSAIIRQDYLEPSTKTLLPMLIPALDMIGGALPAITSLTPPASFSDDATGDVALLTFKPLETQAGQISLSGFTAAPAETREVEEATMTKEIELERLRQENEKAVAKLEKDQVVLAESQKAHEVAMAEGEKKIHEDGAKAFLSNWMKKIPPSEVESTEATLMALRGETYTSFCETIKARPDVEAKNTKGSGPGSGEEEDEREVSFKMNDMIENVLAENEGMSGLDALKIVEAQMSDVQMADYYEEHRPAYDREVIKKKKK